MTGILLGPRYAATPSGGVSLVNQTVFGSSTAVWRIMANGTTVYHDGTGVFVGQDWIYPHVGMAEWECKASLVGGSDPLHISDGLDTWIPCSSSPQWGYSGGAVPRMGSLLISIRRIDLGAGGLVDVQIDLEMGGTLDGGGGGGGGGPIP